MKRTILMFMIAVITYTVKGQTVFDSFDSAIDSNYTVIILGNMSANSRINPFQENQIVYEGQGALRLEYTVESVASWGGATILQLQHPDLMGVWDFSGFESLSVAFYNKTPSSWPGRANLYILLYDVSNVTPTTPLLGAEWWYSFHYVLDRDEGWYLIDLPLKDVGDKADDDDGSNGFWLTGWAGILGNETLDLDQIRGIGFQVLIEGPLDHELIQGEFILDNLVLNPTTTVPVEITIFKAIANGKRVILNWSTATELNNYGFEIQRSFNKNEFITVGFVKGNGTTSDQHTYSYADKNLSNGKYYYRLKQMDYNGSYEYSDVVEVEWRFFNTYLLEQNYPNPFNPITTIGFGVKEKANVKIVVINSIGEEVAVILNGEMEPGFHQVQFNGVNLTSGVYFYQLKAGSFIETKKMILIK
jgi:hypothetical protein